MSRSKSKDSPYVALNSVKFSYETDNPVLRGIDLTLLRGRKYALVGKNGSGKTTLARIISGQLEPDEGTVDYGSELRSKGGRRLISVVDQHLSLFPTLSVLQHFQIRLPRTRPISKQDLAREAGLFLASLRFDLSLDATVENLSFAAQQLLEIALALWTESKLIILDEPTSALDSESSERLFETLDRLTLTGTTLLLISHSTTEIRRFGAEALHVEDGKVEPLKVLASSELEADWEKSSMNAGVIRVHCQTDQSETSHPIPADLPLVLEFEDAYLRSRAWLSLAPHSERQGQSDGALLELSGHDPKSRKVRLIPADRGRFGVFPRLSVQDNFALLSGRNPSSEESTVTKLGEAIESHEITLPSARHPIDTLSGGNQQKIMLGAILGSEADLVIAEELILGLDSDSQKHWLTWSSHFVAKGGSACNSHLFP